MNVKGFILEDDQRREFVLVYEQPYGRLGKTFSLRGWQRRRLVPVQYTEPQLRSMVGGVLTTLQKLFETLPILIEHTAVASSDAVHPVSSVLGLRKKRRPNSPQYARH
jgi:hypothetical protein